MIHRIDQARELEPEPHKIGRGRYLKSIVYGGLDGIITTFAVVSGVAGASLAAKVILILGAANLFADGIAMAFGDFLSTKAENEFNSSERSREEWEVANRPDEERQELVEIYRGKGLNESDTETLVDILEKYPDVMVDTMMVEELGILEDDESPLGNALATLFSFVFFGSFPLSVYLISEFSLFDSIGDFLDKNALLIACLITGSTLFSLGAVKAKVTGQNRIRSGLEMLITHPPKRK
ncbi:MAG: VIT1/CCC1 transporter family protein [Verrucomicrobiales bacterium]|nr:VIT1/CCC1 transporter family protein [Verrucomicrobiales bacterium]